MSKLLEKSKELLTEGGFKVLSELLSRMVLIWDKPVSSTGKYHRRRDGSMPTIGEHTYEMLVAVSKIARLYPYADPRNASYDPKRLDILYLGVILHDALKYGVQAERFHTDTKHDQLIANWLTENDLSIQSHFGGELFADLIRIVGTHQGRWSELSVGFPREQDLVHIIDMLSTADGLQYD